MGEHVSEWDIDWLAVCDPVMLGDCDDVMVIEHSGNTVEPAAQHSQSPEQVGLDKPEVLPYTPGGQSVGAVAPAGQ